MDYLKEAFQKVRQDINSLRKDIDFLTFNLDALNQSILDLREAVQDLKKKEDKSIQIPFKSEIIPSTQTPLIQTTTTYSSTDDISFKALKPQNLPFSTGNEGVPTDRQTNQQTDRHIENSFKNPSLTNQLITKQSIQKTPFLSESSQKPQNTLENASSILASLDNLKKEIRLKFKRLTEREWSVFSTIYQQEEEIGHSDYKSLSKKLNLTESSIRDYIGRLISKGIPVEKTKLNNKNIQLKISDSLKKIATLPTIMQLRDL